MRILMLRHAPTAGNLQKQYIGSTDEPLSPKGIRLASQVQLVDTVTKVYTSGLLRTRQTASFIFPGAECLPISGLNEMSFGDFEGRTYRDMEHDPAYRAWVNANCEPPCPNGESKKGFIERCAPVFRALLQDAYRENPDGDLYFVLHDGTLKALLHTFALPKKSYFDWYTPFCSGYWLRLLEEAFTQKDSGSPFLQVERAFTPTQST